MANLQANRTLSGSFAEVWVDGARIAELSQLTLVDFIQGAEYLDPDVYHESWNVSARDIAADYAVRLQEVGSKGYGIFARYHMFTVENGALVPVNDDFVILLDLCKNCC